MIIQTTKQLRPRDPDDHYPTPPGLARAALRLWPHIRGPVEIADPGAGTGVWGKEARRLWSDSIIGGWETGVFSKPREYDSWQRDWLNSKRYGFHLVMGNPPYREAEAFVRHSLNATYGSGAVILLLRLAFLEGQARMAGLWREWPPTSVRVLGKRPSFTGDGKTDATAYAVFVWLKGEQAEKTELGWLDWEDA